MQEIQWLEKNLTHIYERPSMYGAYNSHIKSVVEHIFHVCCLIIHREWEFESTQQYIRSIQEPSTKDMSVDIESKSTRMKKWGNQEDKVRQDVLAIYREIWNQVQDKVLYETVGIWINYLLTNPPLLRSPNEVNLILNFLFRLALGSNMKEFTRLYDRRVVNIRGSGSIGLTDWQTISISEDKLPSKNIEAFEDVKSVIEKCILYIHDSNHGYEFSEN